jgi:hypothetical protein
MKNTQPNPSDDLVEALAKIEHEQWMHWSQAVAADIADATRVKWQRSWVDYAELRDDSKETDRLWARRVVTLLRQRELIP